MDDRPDVDTVRWLLIELLRESGYTIADDRPDAWHHAIMVDHGNGPVSTNPGYAFHQLILKAKGAPPRDDDVDEILSPAFAIVDHSDG
jgi:hypothetical protein